MKFILCPYCVRASATVRASAKLLMKNDRAIKIFDGSGSEFYPHLKLTRERFPRILATRSIEDDGAEYFGAFLTKTAVRILIDFLNKTFRLRSCDIEIDGNFEVPCTQFYRRRCIAPCVESLCSSESYLEMVGLARLFLANCREDLARELNFRIKSSGENLEFEAAAKWRDILKAVEDFWQRPRLQVWLDDVVDTFVAEETPQDVTVFLVTQRGRRVLGRKSYIFPDSSVSQALKAVVGGFYLFHLPKEIRVYQDFEDRKKLAAALSKKFGRAVKIVLIGESVKRVSTGFALRETREQTELDLARPIATATEIGNLLKREFHLKKKPVIVYAFDVAHISGQGFVAASSVWNAGDFVSNDYNFYLSDQISELAALAESINKKLSNIEQPDLILVDGGKSQLTVAVSSVAHKNIPVISAVKPRDKHSAISHFLRQDRSKIIFNPMNPAHGVLQLLRDNAHDLANQVHRDFRDMAYHYDLAMMLPSVNEAQRRRLLTAVGSARKVATLKSEDISRIFDPKITARIMADLENYRLGKAKIVVPLIVPIRFDAENGGAEDLRPIDSR